MPSLSERLAKVREVWDEKHFKEIARDGTTYNAAREIVQQHEAVISRIQVISKRLDAIQEMLRKDVS